MADRNRAIGVHPIGIELDSVAVGAVGSSPQEIVVLVRQRLAVDVGCLDPGSLHPLHDAVVDGEFRLGILEFHKLRSRAIRHTEVQRQGLDHDRLVVVLLEVGAYVAVSLLQCDFLSLEVVHEVMVDILPVALLEVVLLELEAMRSRVAVGPGPLDVGLTVDSERVGVDLYEVAEVIAACLAGSLGDEHLADDAHGQAVLRGIRVRALLAELS